MLILLIKYTIFYYYYKAVSIVLEVIIVQWRINYYSIYHFTVSIKILHLPIEN